MQDEEPKNTCSKAHSNEMEDEKLTVRIRKEAPTHYTLDIESFPFLQKLLQKTGLDRYESTEFEASGYKWRLILYPEEDKQINGDGHISLYLGIVGIQNLGRAWEIDTLLNFFVYDHNNEQYISFQDGRVKRFNAVKTEWGFSRLLRLTEFNDTSKGHLSRHESCRFGVEVFVIKNEGKGECFLILDNPKKNQFTWNIDKFSSLLESGQYSDEFTIGDYKWKLHLYPKGVPKVKGKFLSIFLCLQDNQKLSSGSKMYVEFKLGIIDVNNPKTEKTGSVWFSGSQTAWGFPMFIKLAGLKEMLGLNAHDHVVVEAEISSISMIKDLSPYI